MEVFLHPPKPVNHLDIQSNSIICVGDTYPKSQELSLSKDLKRLLTSADLSMANLECPLTLGDKPIKKSGPNLKCSPEKAGVLKKAGFDLLVLGNNHIMDYDKQGLEDTLNICRENYLRTVGVGNNIEEAIKPCIYNINDCRIAILSFTENEFSSASGDRPGAAELEPTILWRAITCAKNHADILVVNAHGGSELCPVPSPRLQQWYRYIIDLGADVVIGHHPHVIQGYEIYKDAAILYSLGNFYFPGNFHDNNATNQGLVAKLFFSKKKLTIIELFFINTNIKSGLIDFSDNNLDLLKNHFEKLNKALVSKEILSKYWECHCSLNKQVLLRFLYGIGFSVTLNKKMIKSVLRNLLLHFKLTPLFFIFLLIINKIFGSEKDKLLVETYNRLNCPAHSDVLKTLIELKNKNTEPHKTIFNEYLSLVNELN